MPTYHARGITVRLGSIPLAETTTSDIILRKGQEAKQQSALAETTLLNSSYLQEERVFFPGDPDGFDLNWLGNAPFMQVEVDHGPALPPGLTGSLSKFRTAQALSLHVKLSDRTFHSGFAGKTHLKIEVLFNGQLSACSLIHTNDIRSGAKSLHQVFAGSRIDFLAERPWVLLPPFTTADGGTRRFQKTIDPLTRFEEISVALLKEAEERGTDKNGASPPSAQFIEALATMQTPTSVVNMQKPGGRKFGIVDVIITAGTGYKLTTGMTYLKRPQRLNDPNYVVRAEIESEAERKSKTAAAGSLEEENVTITGTPPQAPNSGLIDAAHAISEGSIDTHNQNSPKCKALSMSDNIPQRKPPFKDLRNPVSGARVPSLPFPIESVSQSNVIPIAGQVSPRCPSPEHRTDGHKEPLPFNGRTHTSYEAWETPQRQIRTRNESHITQEYQTPPVVLCSAFPQPSQIMSPRSVLGQGEFNTPPFAHSAPGTSPIARGLSDYSLCYQQPVLPSEDEPLTLPTPCTAPIERIFPSNSDWVTSPISAHSPYFRTMHFSQQTQPNSCPSSSALCSLPNGLPSLLPQTPISLGRPGSAPFTTPAPSPSTSLQMVNSLPPTAMFSIPSKPLRSASPTKDEPIAEPAKPNTGLLVRHLVITGLNGRPVVDQRWNTVRYAAVDHQSVIGPIVKESESTHDIEYEKPVVGLLAPQPHQSGRSRYLLPAWAMSTTKEAKLDATNSNAHERPHDSLQDVQFKSPTEPLLPYLKRHQGPPSEILHAKTHIDVPDSIAPFVSRPLQTVEAQTQASGSMQMPSSALPAVSITKQRRTLPRSSLPGIQGPKAAPFLFDDPEEVLREAARMRRSRSPTKPVAEPLVSPTTSKARPDTTTSKTNTESSSSLSSVPSLPERNIEPAVQSPTPFGSISQLDGLADRALPSASPRDSSPEKTNLSTPKSQRLNSVTSQSSISPASKKRKLSHRSPVKTSRSPNRLKALSNPPLNDDCVIAFAESKNKDAVSGVLRQVKGERQGVFKEDYVVLAVRYFIAGG